MNPEFTQRNYAYQNEGTVTVNDRTVWLLKVPQFLYKNWIENTDQNVDLGSVRIENTGSAGSIPKISMTLNDTSDNADIPKKYNLNFIRRPQTRCIFTENEEGRAISIAGSIQYEFHVNPEMDEEYRRIMKERSSSSTKPKRSTMFVDESMSSTKFNILAPINEAKLLQRTTKRRLSPDSRRERLPKPELMDLLFRAFEREPYWSLKGLTDHSNQPTVFFDFLLILSCRFTLKKS